MITQQLRTLLHLAVLAVIAVLLVAQVESFAASTTTTFKKSPHHYLKPRQQSLSEQQHDTVIIDRDNEDNNDDRVDVVYTDIPMDYQSANIYMSKYYDDYYVTSEDRDVDDDPNPSVPNKGSSPSPSYFRNPPATNHIYNARQLQLKLSSSSKDDATSQENSLAASGRSSLSSLYLKQYGFTLLKSPQPIHTIVDNWEDPKQLTSQFLPVAKKLITDHLYENDQIADMLFWAPNYRPNTQCYYISKVHLDVDFNAYCSGDGKGDEEQLSVDDLLEFATEILLDDNRNDDYVENEQLEFDLHQKWKDSILQGRRFSMVNLWMNVDTESIQNHPIGLYRPIYDTMDTSLDDKNIGPWSSSPPGNVFSAVPQTRPNIQQSKWYCYPQLTPNEIIAFCQYDRDVRQPSDVWHAAIPSADISTDIVPFKGQEGDDITTTQHPPKRPRKSFDVRCLILFDEQVPTTYDRFSPTNHVKTKKPPEEYWIG